MRRRATAARQTRQCRQQAKAKRLGPPSRRIPRRCLAGKAASAGVGRKQFFQAAGLSGYSSAGIWPPVCAKFLLTMRQRPSMRDSVRKLTNNSVPQNPSSTTVALAASPA